MPMKGIKFKKDEVIGNKTIVRYYKSLGDHHYFFVRCNDCQRVDLMHQGAIRGKKGCRHCFRVKAGFQTELSVKRKIKNE